MPECLGIVVRAMKIPVHDVVATNDDLTALTVRELAARRIVDRHFAMREYRADAGVAVVRVPVMT